MSVHKKLQCCQRLNGKQITKYELEDVQKVMTELSLHPLKGVGNVYSWTNKEVGRDRICSRIGHALGNTSWMNGYSNTLVKYGNANQSDHTPLILHLFKDPPTGARPFCFLNYMENHGDFIRIVEEARNTHSGGPPMERFWRKLQGVKNNLKKRVRRNQL